MFGSKESDMDKNLINKLNVMRILYGKPLVVTSGARCLAHNTEVGGAPNSAHLPHPHTGQCRAADLLVSGGQHRDELMSLAKQVGFERMGVASHFVHLDVAWDLPTPNIFIY
jgi:uncharacterized protein YcbK (DUF882 family)